MMEVVNIFSISYTLISILFLFNWIVLNLNIFHFNYILFYLNSIKFESFENEMKFNSIKITCNVIWREINFPKIN
jgi:hypothetical protein